MKEPRPALENLCCLHAQCKTYGQRGQANLRVRKTYGADRIRYLRCGCCGEEFSERKGTALFNCKIGEAQAVSVIEHLDSACGLNATARLVGVSKEAVGRLLRVSGPVSYQLHDRLVRDLHPMALQFDEKWSYVAKKQRHLTPMDDPSERGDYWDANSLDPQSKLLVSLVPGRRTTTTIHQVVADAAARLSCDARLPALFTDGEPTYPEAIVATFGRAYPVPPIPVPSSASTGPTGCGTHERGAKPCAFRVGRIGMMGSVGLARCATIFITLSVPCASAPTTGDGNRQRRRWPPASPSIAIAHWNSCDSVRSG